MRQEVQILLQTKRALNLLVSKNTEVGCNLVADEEGYVDIVLQGDLHRALGNEAVPRDSETT